MNKTIVAVGIAVAVIVVVGFLAIAGPKEKVDSAVTAGSTIPPVGAIQPSSTTQVVRGGDPLDPTNTATTDSTRTALVCDSKTSSHSRNGKDYRPCDAGFAIDFPGLPQIEKRTDELQLGLIKWSLFTSTQPGQRVADPTYRYAALWGDVSGEPSFEDLEVVLNAAVNQLGAKPGDDSTFNDMSALKFKGDDGFQFSQGIAFTNGHRVFALAVYADALPGLEAELETFKATFHIV